MGAAYRLSLSIFLVAATEFLGLKTRTLWRPLPDLHISLAVKPSLVLHTELGLPKNYERYALGRYGHSLWEINSQRLVLGSVEPRTIVAACEGPIGTGCQRQVLVNYEKKR